MYITREPLSGNCKSKFILIKDCAEASGIKILKAVLNTLLKESVKLHVVYYELMNVNLLSDQNSGNDNVTKVDTVSDPFGWNSLNEETHNLRSLKELSRLCSGLKGVICFDSLSPLLFHNDSNNVYKVLHKILKENADLQIIALMHADVHNMFENEIMERLATTVLNVIPGNKCFSTVHYSSGKVSNQLIEYQVSSGCEFSVFREFHPHIKSVPSKQPDPTANLTFNLRLKKNEIEARSQVQLPYMQMQNKDAQSGFNINNVTEAEMYDEEDPDDDLDI